MATRFDGRVFTFTQPDGSKIQLRGFGDQYDARFETLDGFTVTKNQADGYYEVARLSQDGRRLEPAARPNARLNGVAAGLTPGVRVLGQTPQMPSGGSGLRRGERRCEQRWEARRRERQAPALAATAAPAPPQRHTVGKFVGLCLLIDFSDEHGTISRDEVDHFCNKEGYSGFGNHGSVRDYFHENSLGRCEYTNIVASYYRAKHPKTHYTDPSQPHYKRARELVNEALAHHKAKGFDFSRLSVDGDGYVYAVNVFYAGPVTNNWAEGLWPHSTSLDEAVELDDGQQAFDYQMSAMDAQLEIGVFCHENGHMLCDYPDLYDRDPLHESSGVGAYCLMGSGPNIDPKNPIPISAYLKRLSGWAHEVTELANGKHVTLKARSNDFALFARNDSEYFILENRQKKGRDASLPDQGLAIWHVDESGVNDDEQMTAQHHYELSLEQADGRFDLEHKQYYDGDAGDLFAGPDARFSKDTVPNSDWWSGKKSNLTIDGITSPGDSITFHCYLSNEATKFLSVWRPGTGGQWWATGQSLDDFKKLEKQHLDDGYRLVDLQVLGDGMTAVWRPGTGAQLWSLSMTVDEFKKAEKQNFDGGLRLTCLNVHDGKLTAVWHPGTGGQFVQIGMTADEFKTISKKHADEGLRLARICSHGGKYTAVWHPGTGGQHWALGIPFEEFEKVQKSLFEEGLRLTDVQVHDDLKVTALWRPGTGGLWWASNDDSEIFKRRDRKFFDENYRLIRLCPHAPK